jgi:hypothetical protein
MRTTRVTDAEGYDWEVRAFRVRLPRWRQIDPANWVDEYDLVTGTLILLALPFTLLLIPLALVLAELPLSIGRAVFSETAWVEAVSHWPNERRYLWRTTRADGPGVRAYVAATLPSGGELRPPRAELVETTG